MSGAELAIRPYRSGDELGILRTFNHLFREVCGPGYVDRDLATWEWTYTANPEGYRIQVAATEDGTIAAHYGGVPYRVATPHGDLVFVHIVDSFVHPEHRKGLKAPGLFVRTAVPWFADCYRRGDAVPYGFPVPTAERIGQRYLYYNRLRVVDFLWAPSEFSHPETRGCVHVERVHALGPEVEALFEEFRNDHPCATRRSAAYLTWRYLMAPGAPYEVHLAREHGRLRGLLVLRPRHELVPGACTIVDWMVPGFAPSVVTALLARASEVARERGRACVLAVFAEPSLEFRGLLERGFVRVPSAQTLERRLTFQIYDEHLTEEWLVEHWWYVLGDSDLA